MENSLNETSLRTIDPIIEIHIKKGRVLGIISSREREGKIGVSYLYTYNEITKTVFYVFKKECTEDDVWDYIEDYIGKLMKDNEELIIRTNYWNRGVEYCFTKEIQANIRGHIKRLVRCMIKSDILYVCN
jgi:hypothetical protein